MRKLITGTAAALALAATTLGAVAPAEAQWRGGGYRGHYGGHYGGYGGHYYRGGRTGAAVGAGILGLAVGAALASSGPRGGYYYQPAPRYYAPPPPPVYGYGYCHTEYRWDGYRGGYVPVRFCD